MSIETDARREAERRYPGRYYQIRRPAFEAGAVWASEQADRDLSADTGCPHEACEIDTAGNPTRCADCGNYLDSVPDREPSDADFNRAAQTFYEASGLNLPHTSKPEIVAGVRAAWDALIAARNCREGN